ASSELLALLAAPAAVSASFPALNVREMTSLASVIFLFEASISAFFFFISSSLALSSALGWGALPVAPGGVAEAPPALLISSNVRRLPLPGAKVISTGISRPAFTPGTKFGPAVEWLAATV